MSRIATLLAAIVPSLIAGGLLFGSTAGHAEGDRDDALGFWPAASETTARPVRVAQVDPWARTRPRPPIPPAPPTPPAPPAPGMPPMPPMPPTPPSPHGRNHGRGHGVSVSIHDGKIELDGLEDMVQDQLERVADMLDNLPDVPPDVRERVKSRVRAVRDKLRIRLGKLKSMDLDHLGPEMERMGDEIEREMEGLDKDLAQFGDRFGKHFAQKFGRDFAKNLPGRIAPHDRDTSDDADDDDDKDAAMLPPDRPTDMADPSDLGPAIADLKDLVLDQNQKVQLTQLRLDSDRKVADAKRELEAMSERLHDALGDDRVDADDVARQIDLISQKEATIRKARILTWIKVRGMLDKDQRKKVEAARHH